RRCLRATAFAGVIAAAGGVWLEACTPPVPAPSRTGASARPEARAPIVRAGEAEPAASEEVEEPPAYVSKGREVWRAAAQASDWEEVASKIDALPEPDR